MKRHEKNMKWNCFGQELDDDLVEKASLDNGV